MFKSYAHAKKEETAIEKEASAATKRPLQYQSRIPVIPFRRAALPTGIEVAVLYM
jgi:hypothetical protein